MLFVSSPFAIAGIFVVFLGVSGLLVGSIDSFLGFIVFIVYLGGALILFSYCLILTPLQETSRRVSTACTPIALLCVCRPMLSHSTLYEFYWVSYLLFSVGVLLFVVMLCVVSLIDFSQGSMRVL